MNRAFGVLLWAAAALALAFLLVPIAAIFLRVPPGELVEALGSPVARDALRVTVTTTLVAQFVILVVGTPAAYLIATRRLRGRALVITLVELPLVLPPAVAGIALLAAFGRFGRLGETLSFSGIEVHSHDLPSCWRSSSSPARSSFAPRLPRSRPWTRPLVDTSRTLALDRRVRSPVSRYRSRRVASVRAPRSRSPAGSGSSARPSCSPDRSRASPRSLSLAVYEQFDVDFDTALAIGAELVAASAVLLLAVRLIPSWRSSTQSFPTPFARSTSS